MTTVAGHLPTDIAPSDDSSKVFGKGGEQPPSRINKSCTSYHDILKPIPHEEAALTVPAYVAIAHRRFVQCPNCGRIYWPGTHWVQMLTCLQELKAS